MPRPMPEILEALLPLVGPSHEAGRVRENLLFCPACGNATLASDLTMGFACSDRACGYEGVRALTFRREARFEIRGGRLYHFSVGAGILCRFREEAEDRVLLLRRATHPVGAFTVPSGHWDLDDALPVDAARREVEEETGLTACIDWQLVSEPNELVAEGCRRAADHHYWHFFRCRCPEGDAAVRLQPDVPRRIIGESDMIGWVPVSQVRAGQFALTKPAGLFLGRILDAAIPNSLET